METKYRDYKGIATADGLSMNNNELNALLVELEIDTSKYEGVGAEICIYSNEFKLRVICIDLTKQKGEENYYLRIEIPFTNDRLSRIFEDFKAVVVKSEKVKMEELKATKYISIVDPDELKED